MKHITIKDVARELNCSISTVSRAFNNKYDIKPETRDRILKVATELGYSPNPIARRLIERRTYTVGVIVPEFINSFFPKTIIGMQEVLLNKGYQVLIMQSNESSETELNNMKTLVDGFVDGIIVSLTEEDKNIGFLKELKEKEFPIVLFNRVNHTLPLPKIVFDNYKWSMFATEHLIRQGITDLKFLGGPRHSYVSNNRKRGFLDALKKHRLFYSEDLIVEAGFHIDDGDQAVEALINKNQLPQGFVCVNDPAAIGCIKALKRYGYKIPEEIAVVGFTESAVSSLIDPPLTSVSQPAHDIGVAAAEQLLLQIESAGKMNPETITFNGQLNVRESSLRVK
ncbi:MAG: LacI family DNA-binding transcriptional regulator [Cyclobacteriaceae bacterium]